MSRELRARWRATAALALIVAAVTGVVLAFAAGAVRTSSAPNRYTSASGGGYDFEVQQETGRPRTAEVAVLPSVSSVDAATFVFAKMAKPGGAPVSDALVFAGSYRATGMRLVAGRDPEPASRTEFVATRGFAEAKGVTLGARFDVLTLSQEQADRAGFDAFGTDGAATRSLEAVLVGVVDGPGRLDDPTPMAVLSTSLLDEPDVGVAATIMSVRLRPGTNLDSFRQALDGLPNGDTLSLKPFALISPEIKTAVGGQARGLWVLSLVGAIAALVVLGQLVTRHIRLSAEEAPRLGAIGFSKSQLLAEQVGRGTVPLLAGMVLGMVVATGLSSAFPSGFVRRIEPHPGLRFDAPVLALCGAGLLAALLLWILTALVLARPVRVGGPAPLVEAVAARSDRAAFSTGIRFAFTRSRRDRGSIRATVTGMLATAAVLVGAIVFGSSLGRLVSDGSRFGHNFDVLFGTGGNAISDELRAVLETDHDVTGVMLYGVGQGRVGPVTLGLAGMEPVRGNLAPRVLTGRLPVSDDEVALGRLAATSVGAQPGADLTIDGEGPARTYRVTGLVVVPDVEGLDGVGQDAILTMGGLARFDAEARPSVAAVSLRTRPVAATADRLAERAGLPADFGGGVEARPVVITNLARIRSTPYVLAWMVGALMVLTVVHVMITSVRNRRRDVAVLRSLGADGRWITRAVHWQATTFSLVPLALGAPLGLMAGRLLFQTFANAVGTVPEASFPYVLLAAVIAGILALANAAAAVPARRARRLAPAPLLTAE